jgi:hypothetical protein
MLFASVQWVIEPAQFCRYSGLRDATPRVFDDDQHAASAKDVDGSVSAAQGSLDAEASFSRSVGAFADAVVMEDLSGL